MRKGKTSVVWELVEAEGSPRLVVDVDAPLRPFGADPTPPHGTRLPSATDDGLSDDTLLDVELPAPSEPAPLPTTEALLKALRARSKGG